MNTEKIVAIFFICILILNIVLFALRIISDTVFWIVLLAGFVVSYTIKRMNKSKEKNNGKRR